MRWVKNRIRYWFVFLLFLSSETFSQNCCDIPACRDRTQQLMNRILPLMQSVGTATDSAARNKAILQAANQRNPGLVRNFTSVMYETLVFLQQDGQDRCFRTLMPPDQMENLNRWLIYFNDIKNPVTFPSPEFCTGFRTRLELSQGASDFMRDEMAYLGSIRGLLMYTFGKKNSCGNRFRLLAGPAFFLRNETPYISFNGRLAYRIKDIMVKNPPIFLGNFNLFAEYLSNFDRFNYAALGFEANLGRFGVNLAVNHNFDTDHQGFLVGLVLMNKKKK